MNTLKPWILAAIACFASVASLCAQSYSLLPNDTVLVNAFLEDQETLTIQQLNPNNDTLILKWIKVSVTLPSKWDASMCDNQFCNCNLADSGTMNPVYTSNPGLLLVHCTSHVNSGTAVIRYAVWDSKSPAKKDTLTFIFNVNKTGIVQKDETTPKLWLEGNTVHIKTNSEDFSMVQLFDFTGKEVFKSSLNFSDKVVLPLTSASFYLLQLSGRTSVYRQRIYFTNQ